MKKLRDEVKNIRRSFDFGTLELDQTPTNPFDVMENWMEVAIKKQPKDPNAFVLSTVSNHIPDSRVVLLRDFDENGFTFYTNYESKKGTEIEENKAVAMNFYWIELDRQVRIQGKIKRVNAKISDEYFNSRPRESQIGAWASKQSTKIKSRAALEEEVERITKKFEGKEVKRPPFWGGYIIEPNYFEFWQGRPSRLHDRLAFDLKDGNWLINRLSP